MDVRGEQNTRPPRPSITGLAILLVPIGVIVGTGAAVIAFLINSQIGVNAHYPINALGLFVTVPLGLLISLVVTAFGVVALLVSSRVWGDRTAALVPGVFIGCLIGGVAGSVVIRSGLDSWADAISQSEIIGATLAVLFAAVVAIQQAISVRRRPADV